MDLLAELTEARQNITVLEGTIANHVATITSNGVEIAALTEARDLAQGELASVRTELATANTNLQSANALVAERDGTITTLRSEAASAEQRVMERLGRGGAPAAKKPVQEGAITTGAQALDAYAKITDARERGKFYADHKDLMFPPKK